MSLSFDPELELERYELAGDPAYTGGMSRRDFFQLVGGGLIVLLLAASGEAQESGGGRRRGGGTVPQELDAWLHVAEDGRVTVYTGKVEVGQNIRTSLTQAVAEELHAPMRSIRLVMADTQLTPYDAGTFGSRTTPTMVQQLRKVGAAAREALIDLAAEQWKADRSMLSIVDGRVTNRTTGQSADFGTLTRGQKLTRTLSDTVPTTPSTDWTVLGHAVPRVDARELVTGKHRYTTDVRLPGMVYGKVLRPPAFGATLASADTRAASALNGVTVVHQGEFLGVTAPNSFQAAQALKAIQAEWKSTPQPSGKELFDLLKQPGGPGGRDGGASRAGSMKDGLDSADVRLQAAYTIAYIAHAPLEPRAAVAQWEGEKLTVWTGTQRPFGVRSELAQAFNLPETSVRVIVPDTGSGYGGKHTGEAAVEAARLARAVGKPVKLVWTREEEFTWAYFRPAGVIEVSSGARKDGTLTAWEFHNYNSGGSGIRTPYEVPNQVVQSHSSRSPLKQGSYRGLAATANHFARECHMDDVAHALGMDPLDFRLRNLKDERLRAVLQAAAAKFGWGAKAPVGHGYGLACGLEKGGYVATCAEVSVDPTTQRPLVHRAVSAFECGAITNPDGLRAQVEGALLMGLGGALTEAIEFDEGKILNPRFSKYRVPRFSDLPQIEVVLLDRKDLPSAGAGETPIIGIAPAVGNAIFAATGVRVRSLPMAPQGVPKEG